MQKINPEKHINTFFKKLGLEQVNDIQKGELLESMGNLAFQRLVVRVAEKLSTEDRRLFAELLDKDDKEKLAEFLYDKFPNIDELFEEESRAVIADTKNDVAYIHGEV